ncbi:MAG TPA: NAD(P)-dependent oxidoreductase, partial [Chloroflexota bacterium]|nr:NAD(P)-dependent oxidoreductase [Chloroflexota bacterium]
ALAHGGRRDRDSRGTLSSLSPVECHPMASSHSTARHILLTGAASPLGQAIATALADAGHTVRRTDSQQPSSAGANVSQGDLADPEFVRPLLDSIDVVVHLAPLTLPSVMPADAPGEILDAVSRGTHVLYKAALEAGVLQAVQASTLAVMDAYDQDLEVTEQWRPRPAPVPEHLAPYLAELVAREFTRDVALESHPTIICLRFDTLSDAPPDRQLDLKSATSAVVHALETLQTNPRQRGHRWHVLHIAPPTRDARYSSDLAQRTIGYGGAA